MSGQPQQQTDAQRWKDDKRSVPMADGVVTAVDVDQFTTYCTALSRSKAIPECYRDEPGSIMSALILGRDLGVGDGAMLQNSFVLDGRVHPMTYLLLGCCMKSPMFDASKYRVWVTGERFKDDYTWHCQAARTGGVPQEFTYTVAMAKIAGLWDKSSKSGKPLPWKLFPDDLGSKMPIARMMRKLFPDLIMGLVTQEEMAHAAAVDDAVDNLDLSDADLTKQLTTPIGPEIVDGLQEVVNAVAAETNTLPPPDPELAAANGETFEKIKKLYNAMTPNQLDPIRKNMNFGMVSEVEAWTPGEQTNLLIDLQDAAKA